MNKLAQLDKINSSLLGKLDPEGKLNIASCLQCGRCSSGCTMRQETDILPHQINRLVVLGMEEQLITSKAIWTCASCHTCVSRCPMGVDTPALIDKLRNEATQAPSELEKIRTFNEIMLGSMKRFGRVYEFAMMGEYKLKTRDFFSDLAKFPVMLIKGKMKLIPPATKGKQAAADVFDRVRENRRAK